MGYWNNGMLEYWVWRDDYNQKLKSEHHPLFIPNIPYPLFHYSIGLLTANTTPLG
jgi:hypothetical protein